MVITNSNGVVKETGIQISTLNPKQSSSLGPFGRILPMESCKFIIKSIKVIRRIVRVTIQLIMGLSLQNFHFQSVDRGINMAQTDFLPRYELRSGTRQKMRKSVHRVGMRKEISSIPNH